MGHLQIINNVNQKKKKKHNYQNTFTCLNFSFFKYFTQCFELCLKGKKIIKGPKGFESMTNRIVDNSLHYAVK